MSGVEMISPQREMAKAHQFPCSIEGVGDVRTSWIGQQGVILILISPNYNTNHSITISGQSN